MGKATGFWSKLSIILAVGQLGLSIYKQYQASKRDKVNNVK
ncbi:hypothetical protein [Lentilactobacillus kisonensis]|nr:hypothetical protein [Lentilactobacillus kisonensis]